MDYSQFFPGSGTPYNYMEIPPPNAGFVDPENKMPVVSTDPLDTSLFPASFDAFRFNNPILDPTDLSASLPLAIDTAVGPSDNMSDLMSPLQQSHSNQQQPSQTLQHQESDGAHSRQRRGSSEERELTPAQSRRKAQNRAAQRAFRERKERHVKELEAKLSALESSATSLASDNERLRLALQRATTEVEILRSNRLSISGPSGSPLPEGDDNASIQGAESVADPKDIRRNSVARPGDPHYNPDSNLAASLWKTTSQDNKLQPTSSGGSSAIPTPSSISPANTNNSSNTSITSIAQPASVARGGDERLIPAGAVWDLIQAHPLVRNGSVDIADVCERLRGAARTDGLGPVFAAGDIRRAVEESRRGGGDELI